MTETAFKAYIHRRKERHGTWRNFAEILRVPLSSLHDAAKEGEIPAPNVIEALGFRQLRAYSKLTYTHAPAVATTEAKRQRTSKQRSQNLRMARKIGGKA